MYGLVKKYLKADTLSMACIYCLDFVASIVFIYLIWRANNKFIGESQFFVIFYSFERGVSIVVDILLLRRVIFNSIIKNAMSEQIHLLLLYAAVQAAGFAVDIVYYCFFDSRFFTDGYLIMLLEAVLAVVYFRRYCLLRTIREEFSKETEGMPWVPT